MPKGFAGNIVFQQLVLAKPDFSNPDTVSGGIIGHPRHTGIFFQNFFHLHRQPDSVPALCRLELYLQGPGSHDHGEFILPFFKYQPRRRLMGKIGNYTVSNGSFISL